MNPARVHGPRSIAGCVVAAARQRSEIPPTHVFSHAFQPLKEGFVMKPMLSVALLACGLLGFASSSPAQIPRQDVIWARSTAGQPIKLDGVLDEPAWSKAESYTVRFHTNNGDPGSGWKFESGISPTDPLVATFKFLVNGDSLYMAAVVTDSSVGGSADFNRFDGLLMSIKDHRDPNATIAGPTEYLYSWWHPEDPNPTAPGKAPGFRGYWTPQSDTIPRTPEQIEAWNAVTKVRGGISNSDAVPDSGYTVEMRFDVGLMGYHPSVPQGDIVEWNASVYDCDWLWPFQNKFSANRTWWQSPWGRDMWYDEVKVYCDPAVTINSGPVPAIGPDVRIPNAGSYPVPTIDGFLTDPVWNTAQHFDIRYGDFDLRNKYPGVMRWRAGQYQAPVNGGLAEVVDPGDATIHWFFKGDTLYMGFDVRDQVVQYHTLEDRWDGFKVTIVDTSSGVHETNEDHVRDIRSLGFHVGPTGAPLADDYLPYLRDTLHAAKLGLKLKPNTTVDTLGSTPDQGYTAELSVNLRALGFPAGLGTRPLWIGIDMYDGDSYLPITDSYGTRTWWGVERAGQCCPAAAYLDPTYFLTAVDESNAASDRARLLGNYPNPFRHLTVMRYALPAAAKVTLEVYDLQGRAIARRALGLQEAGTRQASFARTGLAAGLYVYRLKLENPTTGAPAGALSGKMMVLK